MQLIAGVYFVLYFLVNGSCALLYIVYNLYFPIIRLVDVEGCYVYKFQCVRLNLVSNCFAYTVDVSQIVCTDYVSYTTLELLLSHNVNDKYIYKFVQNYNSEQLSLHSGSGINPA